MREIFNFLKDTLRKLDGYWIENAGHPIIVKGVFKANFDDKILYQEEFEPCTPVLLYGFYDYPSEKQYSVFGIDAHDELELQVNAENLLRKMRKPIAIGTLLIIENDNWIVINRGWIYNRFIGKWRMNITCQRYQESVTTEGIHIKTQSDHQAVMDEE